MSGESWQVSPWFQQCTFLQSRPGRRCDLHCVQRQCELMQVILPASTRLLNTYDTSDTLSSPGKSKFWYLGGISESRREPGALKTPRRKQPMALGPGFQLQERRGLDNRFSRPFSHQSSMDLHQDRVGQSPNLDTRSHGAMEKTGTEKSTLGSEFGFQKESCVLAAGPSQTLAGDRISSPTCERRSRGWTSGHRFMINNGRGMLTSSRRPPAARTWMSQMKVHSTTPAGHSAASPSWASSASLLQPFKSASKTKVSKILPARCNLLKKNRLLQKA